MKAKFEKFYLQYRLPALICLSGVVAVFVGVNQWIEYQYRNAKYPTWTVGAVTAGDIFTVTSDLDSETRTIKLCGVTPAHSEAKDFLKSVINRGDGSIELERSGEAHEAWVMLKPDFESQIHVNTYMVEKGMARHDTANSQQCRSNEELGFAQKIAQEEKLGLWNSK